MKPKVSQLLRLFGNGKMDDAISKVSGPFELLKAKQNQVRASMDAAKSKVEASKNLLAAKELAHKTVRERASNTLSQAEKRANQSKSGIEERQQELLKADALVKTFIDKVESQVKSSAPKDASRRVK